MIGIDEVGRGAWAGPLLVVAARAKAILPVSLTDSKSLSKLKRESLIAEIEASCDLGCGWVENTEVDSLGLTKAMYMGAERALNQINPHPHEKIIIDGNINYCNSTYQNVLTKIKADLTVPIVSAASIYAKVMRDKFMQKVAEKYPEYGFENHVGYGTKAHREALRIHGITKIHRVSYKPIRTFL